MEGQNIYSCHYYYWFDEWTQMNHIIAGGVTTIQLIYVDNKADRINFLIYTVFLDKILENLYI